LINTPTSTHHGLLSSSQQHLSVRQDHGLGINQPVLVDQVHGAGNHSLIRQVGDVSQASVVATNLQHQGAALEGISHGGKLRGHCGKGGLSQGSLGGSSLEGLW